MTDKLLCPFCGQELDWLSEDIYGNRCCNNCTKLYGSEELWQALIDTKKKLDAIEHLVSLMYSVLGETDLFFQGYSNLTCPEIHAKIKTVIADVFIKS